MTKIYKSFDEWFFDIQPTLSCYCVDDLKIGYDARNVEIDQLNQQKDKLSKEFRRLHKRLEMANSHICDMCMADHGCDECEWQR